MDEELFAKFQEYIQDAYEQKKLRTDFSFKDKFSLFKSVADQYRKENFHSDILKIILDPNTIQIGNRKHLELFIKTIGLKLTLSENDCVTVEREEKRIDILIKIVNPKYKKAIIIENKINDAYDQDNQLARYYEMLTSEGYTVLKIPYITLYGGKIPNYSKWDNKYKESAKLIFEGNYPLFFDLPVKKQNNSILSFLDNCIKIYQAKNQKNDNTLALVFLEQYKLLLEEIAEDTVVSPKEVDIIKKLFEDDKKAELQALLESWGNRGFCAYEYIKKNLPNNIKLKKVYGAVCLTIDNIQGNNQIEGVYIYPLKTGLQIGFYKNNYLTQKTETKLFTKLETICKVQLLSEIRTDDILEYKNWYCVNIEIDKSNSFDDIKSAFTNALIELSKF